MEIETQRLPFTLTWQCCAMSVNSLLCEVRHDYPSRGNRCRSYLIAFTFPHKLAFSAKVVHSLRQGQTILAWDYVTQRMRTVTNTNIAVIAKQRGQMMARHNDYFLNSSLTTYSSISCSVGSLKLWRWVLDEVNWSLSANAPQSAPSCSTLRSLHSFVFKRGSNEWSSAPDFKTTWTLRHTAKSLVSDNFSETAKKFGVKPLCRTTDWDRTSNTKSTDGRKRLANTWRTYRNRTLPAYGVVT